MFDAKDARGRELQISQGLRERRFERQGQAAEGLFDVLADLRDWSAAELTARDFLQFAGGRSDKTIGQVVLLEYDLAWAIEEQGREKEAEAIRLRLLSDVQRETTVWGAVGDRILSADLASSAKKDEASLKEARRLLNETEIQAKYPDWLSGWWHGIYARIEKKLGNRQASIQHARISAEKGTVEQVYILQYAENRLVDALRDASELPEAEAVRRKALAGREKRFGNAHILTSYARMDLAEFLIEVKKYTEADGLLQQVQKSLLSDQRVPASQRQRVAGTLAKLYEATGKQDQASLWRAKRDAIATSSPSDPAGNPSGNLNAKKSP